MTPISPAALPELEIPEPRQKAEILTTGDEEGVDVEEQDPNELDLGYLLTAPKPEAAKRVEEEVEDQEPQMTRNRAVWKRSAWWREGKRWVKLEKKQDQSLWEAKLPPGMANAPPVPNKTDRLCRRTVNVLMVDPPFPECEPGDSSPEARDAAEFSTKYLSVRGSANELNFSQLCRRAAGKAMTYASSFAWVIMDPTAGGNRPRQAFAHPAAPDYDTALIDPETEVEAPEEALVERYVKPDQTLTDDPNEADIQWLPNHKVRLITGKNLIFLPATAQGIRDAEGVIITDHTTLGDLKEQFPDEFRAMSKEKLDELCQWKPDRYREILPLYAPDQKDQKDPNTHEWRDSQTVWTRSVYFRACAEYPKGCYLIKAGKDTILYRDVWTAMMEQPAAEDGTEQPEKEVTLRIPVAQCRCLDDDNFDNGYGIGMAEHLGPADEIRASSLGYQLEYLFRFGNPIQFLPMGTVIQPKQLTRRDGNPVYFNPQGKPQTEEVPELPAVVPELRNEMGREMDDEAGLQQTGQGVETPSVKSGIHARTIVQEALKAISNQKDNLEYFYIDLCSIVLEQSKAFCSVETMLSYVGEDGEYKQKNWSRSDFRNTKTVGIKRGSFTMHTPMAKQELANEAFDRKVIGPEEYQELASGGISPILGAQENPHLMRIRRQLDAFDDGPPEGWLEAMQAHQMGLEEQEAWTQQQITNAGLGLPPDPLDIPPEVPPPPPGPFEPLPIDELPEAAKIRHRQMTRFMASSKYIVYPPEWRAMLEQEMAKAANAAGIITVVQAQEMARIQKAQGIAGGQPPGPGGPPAPAGQPGAPAGAQPMQGQPAGPPAAGGPSPLAAAMPNAPLPPMPPPPPPITINNIMPSGAQDIRHIHDEGGRLVGSSIRPV